MMASTNLGYLLVAQFAIIKYHIISPHTQSTAVVRPWIHSSLLWVAYIPTIISQCTLQWCSEHQKFWYITSYIHIFLKSQLLHQYCAGSSVWQRTCSAIPVGSLQAEWREGRHSRQLWTTPHRRQLWTTSHSRQLWTTSTCGQLRHTSFPLHPSDNYNNHYNHHKYHSKAFL